MASGEASERQRSHRHHEDADRPAEREEGSRNHASFPEATTEPARRLNLAAGGIRAPDTGSSAAEAADYQSSARQQSPDNAGEAGKSRSSFECSGGRAPNCKQAASANGSEAARRIRRTSSMRPQALQQRSRQSPLLPARRNSRRRPTPAMLQPLPPGYGRQWQREIPRRPSSWQTCTSKATAFRRAAIRRWFCCDQLLPKRTLRAQPSGFAVCDRNMCSPQSCARLSIHEPGAGSQSQRLLGARFPATALDPDDSRKNVSRRRKTNR